MGEQEETFSCFDDRDPDDPLYRIVWNTKFRPAGIRVKGATHETLNGWYHLRQNHELPPSFGLHWLDNWREDTMGRVWYQHEKPKHKHCVIYWDKGSKNVTPARWELVDETDMVRYQCRS